MSLTLAVLTGGKAAVIEHLKTCGMTKAETDAMPALQAAAAKRIERLAAVNAAATMLPILQSALDTHKLVVGDRPAPTTENPDAADEWDEGIDTAVEEAMKPYQGQLSADWLGQKTIQTLLHAENAVDALAGDFGKEIVKQLVHDAKKGGPKSPAKILSAAGILEEDLIPLIGMRPTRKRKGAAEAAAGPVEEASITADEASIFEGIRAFVVATAMSQDAFETAIDDASGADLDVAFNGCRNLGVPPTAEHVEVLQTARLVEGLDGLQTRIRDMTASQVERPAPPPVDNGSMKNRRPEGGAMPLEVFQGLAALGMSDGRIAEMIGVSRAAVNQYRNGKTNFEPDPDQVDKLKRSLLDMRGLLEKAVRSLQAAFPG